MTFCGMNMAKPWVSPEYTRASWISEREITFRVVSAFDSSLCESLDWVANDSQTLTLDVKWKNDTKEVKHMPSLFTVASPERVLIITYPETCPPNEPLAQFLQSHVFYMMTTLASTRKMCDKFGHAFATEQFREVKNEALRAMSEKRFKDLMNGLVKQISGSWWSKWSIENLLVGNVMWLVNDAYALHRLIETQRTESANIEAVDEIAARIDEPPLAQRKYTWIDTLGICVINTVKQRVGPMKVLEIPEMGMSFFVKKGAKVYPLDPSIRVPGEPLFRTYGRIAARAIVKAATSVELNCPWLIGSHSRVRIEAHHGKLQIKGIGPRGSGQVIPLPGFGNRFP